LTSAKAFACTVRGCGQPLTQRDRALVCSVGHSFDIARSGYINLLQPQDRRSTKAGDSKAAVEARAALEALGVGRALIDALALRLRALNLPGDAIAVDLGSGTGEVLGQLCKDLSLGGIGIDLSPAAADMAARRFSSLAWIVANADRRLPLQDKSVDVVLSVYGRRNPAECARVLTKGGTLMVALPAPDDLIELRASVQGEPVERDRVEAMLEEHHAHFTPTDRFTVRERMTLPREALLNLLRGTYRGARFTLADRVEGIGEMQVTMASEISVMSLRQV
jgi:23S rRNA (guanine745-N1)-methyltransferase